MYHPSEKFRLGRLVGIVTASHNLISDLRCVKVNNQRDADDPGNAI